LADSRRKGSGFLKSSWNVYKKTAGKLNKDLVLLHNFFVLNELKTQWIEEICNTPAEKQASRDPTGACVEEVWQIVGGKGADFRIQFFK
jgi:hypothetical protein